MKKILIIGQAPPADKQQYPYDTTMLYEMLSWIGISKERAQEIFDFDAMTDKFPGHGINGHLKPGVDEMRSYYKRVLFPKINQYKRVILLGAVSREYCREFGIYSITQDIIHLIHPSRRNYSKIMQDKTKITKALADFIPSYEYL